MKRPATVLLLLLGAAAPAMAHQELVLITSAQSHLTQLEPPLARRLFLGLTVAQNGVTLRPLLNESNPQITEAFLSHIVAMSDSTYHRYLLRLVLIQGRTQPTAYKNSSALIEAVASDPAAVGYLWVDDAVHDPRIRVLQSVWHD